MLKPSTWTDISRKGRSMSFFQLGTPSQLCDVRLYKCQCFEAENITLVQDEEHVCDKHSFSVEQGVGCKVKVKGGV